jgi:hypothetical protein
MFKLENKSAPIYRIGIPVGLWINIGLIILQLILQSSYISILILMIFIYLVVLCLYILRNRAK